MAAKAFSIDRRDIIDYLLAQHFNDYHLYLARQYPGNVNDRAAGRSEEL